MPANDYLDWSVQVYPGQALREGASGITDDPSEGVDGFLEILVMDDENFAHYEASDYAGMTERYHKGISANWWDSLDVNVQWFGRVHVV